MKRKGTTGQVEACAKFLEEEKFSFQCAISKFVTEYDIPLYLVFDQDQSQITYVSPGKYTFDLKGSTIVPIKGVSDKRQITATFTISASGSFLLFNSSIILKTMRCLPTYHFPNCFYVTFTPNHWSIFEKCFSLLGKIICPYLKVKKKNLVTQRNNTRNGYLQGSR